MPALDSGSQWIVLAHILRPQGRKGEVLADLFTDFPERFGEKPEVWLAAAGFADGTQGSDAAPASAVVTSHWLPVGKNLGRIVLHFAGIDTIGQAGQLTGKDVVVPLAERMPLDPGAAYISDLIGCAVFDRERLLGTVESVQFPTAPDGSRRLEEAAPLLAVTSPEGEEVLVPYVEAYLLELDIAGRSIRMALPEGLAELNRKTGRAAEST